MKHLTYLLCLAPSLAFAQAPPPVPPVPAPPDPLAIAQACQQRLVQEFSNGLALQTQVVTLQKQVTDLQQQIEQLKKPPTPAKP